MRPSHDTREETVAALRRGYLAGRLGTETFVRRVDDALHSSDRNELRGLTADLPASPQAPLTRLRARLGPRPRGLGLPAAADLLRARVLIGRSSSCQLVLADDTVSRPCLALRARRRFASAELRIEGGRWLLRDLGSSNGTWVNGRRVVEAEVRPGDVLHLGGCTLRL